MNINLYFKCRRCGYIFYKDSKKFVEDKDIQETLKNSYVVEFDTCKSCVDYEKWERNEYFN